MDNALIGAFGIPFRGYAVLVVLGTWAAIETAARLARRDARDPEHIWRAMLWVIPLAVIGARLWYVLFPPQAAVGNGLTADWMILHFFDLNQGAIAVWSGGLGLIGAIIGGTIGLALYARRQGLPLLPWLDIGAVGLALGQAIGLWGVGVNQEAYGHPVDLPWAVQIADPAARVGPYTDLARYPLETTTFHPIWLYESIWCAFIFTVLLALFLRRRSRPGQIALTYVLLYSGGRFLLEFMKVNISLVAGINVSQIVMAAALATSVGLALRQRAHASNRAVNQIAHPDAHSGDDR